MTTARSYRQYCGIARALDLIGERWALLVIRELVFGPKRFTDLRHGLPGIATNVLSQRLRELALNGVVARRRLPPPAASDVYELTEYGQELVPIMLALGRWGSRTLGTRLPEHTMQPEWLAVALKAFFRPEAAEDVSATVVFDLGGAPFALRLHEAGLELVPVDERHADLTITTDPEALVAFLAGGPAPTEVRGDQNLLARLPAIFAFGAGRPAAFAT